MVCEGLKLNIFVGSKIGTFKHIRYDQLSKKKRKDVTRQLQDVKSIQKGDGISCMAFKDPEETEIVLGRNNRIIQTYNLLNDQLDHTCAVDFGEGKLHSLSAYENTTLIGAVQSGIVKVWKSKIVDGFELNAGPNLECMRHCLDNKKLIGTGGKENDLKIWDLEKQECTFLAKNVPHDWLQLRVPIWISDICFMPDTDGKQVAISSRYGVVRLYDTRAQRRPVCSVEFQGQANTCIATGFREREVIVGTGRGFMQMVDLRGAGKPDKSYKGSTGAITAALCLLDRGVVVSTSLDRHLRIHKADTKELVHKQYMTTKLTTLLVRSSGKTPLPQELLYGDEGVKNEDVKGELEFISEDKSDSEFEEIFNNMEVIGDDSFNKKKRKTSQEIKNEQHKSKQQRVSELINTETPVKKLKRSQDNPDDLHQNTSTKKNKKKEEEETTVNEDQPETSLLEENIKKLLKSTDKRNKQLQKSKLEKKRRSVFNC